MQKVLFVHFHKAAGSSIVNYFDEKGFITVANRNGNPLNSEGRLHRIWEMEDKNLSILLDHLESVGNRFIAVEWGIPNLTLFRERGYKVITVIREPHERLISNYRFDVQNFIKNTPFSIYIDSPQIIYQRLDYYTYMIKSYLGRHVSCNLLKSDIEEFLNNFDEILVLERGCFYKIIDANIVKIEVIPRKNSTRRRWFKKHIEVSDLNIDFQDKNFFEIVKQKC